MCFSWISDRQGLLDMLNNLRAWDLSAVVDSHAFLKRYWISPAPYGAAKFMSLRIHLETVYYYLKAL